MKWSYDNNFASLSMSIICPSEIWVGVFERISEGELSVCKVTFGEGPKDYEIYDFVLKNYYWLRFSPAVATDEKEACRNPKWYSERYGNRYRIPR